MHTVRKPGEQIEVDWAGDPIYIADPNTGEATKINLFIVYNLEHKSSNAKRCAKYRAGKKKA